MKFAKEEDMKAMGLGYRMLFWDQLRTIDASIAVRVITFSRLV